MNISIFTPHCKFHLLKYIHLDGVLCQSIMLFNYCQKVLISIFEILSLIWESDHLNNNTVYISMRMRLHNSWLSHSIKLFVSKLNFITRLCNTNYHSHMLLKNVVCAKAPNHPATYTSVIGQLVIILIMAWFQYSIFNLN